jgi:ferritin-like metal-binding protein YciE
MKRQVSPKATLISSNRGTVGYVLSYGYREPINQAGTQPTSKKGILMKLDSLENLFVHELKDLLSAEKQLVKALPKMAKGATSEALQAGFEEHLEQTKGHVERLEQIFEMLGKTARAEHCKAMQGLIEEGAGLLEEDGVGSVKDAALIGAAQRVEHYEIAAYGTARSLAELLGRSDVVELLEQTLEEEKETDEKLTELAMSEVNPEAQEAIDD